MGSSLSGCTIDVSDASNEVADSSETALLKELASVMPEFVLASMRREVFGAPSRMRAIAPRGGALALAVELEMASCCLHGRKSDICGLVARTSSHNWPEELRGFAFRVSFGRDEATAVRKIRVIFIRADAKGWLRHGSAP